MPDDPNFVPPPEPDMSGLDFTGQSAIQAGTDAGLQSVPPPAMPQTTGMDTGGLQAPPPQQNLPPIPPRPVGTGVAAQPTDRKAYFREMLGNFLYSVGQGLSQSGQGPGANARGLGAALTAIPQRDMMLKQLQIQQQQAQATEALKQAQAQAAQAGAEPTPVTINGQQVMLPASIAKQILAAQATGQSRENVQDKKNQGAAVVQGMKNEGAANVAGLKISSAEKIANLKLQSGEKLSADKLQMMREVLADRNEYQKASLALRQAGFGMRQQEFAQKQEALSPTAQKVLMDTTPTHDQIKDLMEQFEPLKNDNSPASHAIDRAKYAIGIATPTGKVADQIAQLELTRVVAGARVLKGSSRAIQALQMAMKHAPNVWTDSNELIYGKLKNLDQALQQVEDAAYTYGKKTGVVPPSGTGSKTGGGSYSADNPFAPKK